MTDAETLIQAYYHAFNARDWPAMLSLLTETVAHDINQGARETGREAFAAFLQRMDTSYAEHLTDIVVLTAAGGTRAAAEFIVHGMYNKADPGLPAAHGQTYVLPAGAFFELTGGKIARVSNYYNLEDWVRQVS